LTIRSWCRRGAEPIDKAVEAPDDERVVGTELVENSLHSGGLVAGVRTSIHHFAEGLGDSEGI
jgi:hypothetical protein